MTEIWIRGRLLCKIENDNAAIEQFEQIVRKAGYDIQEKQEGNKTIKMI